MAQEDSIPPGFVKFTGELDPPAESNVPPGFVPFTGKLDAPAGGTASDLAKSLKVGTQRLPGMVTGLADLPFALAAGARPFTKAADALGEVTGFQPGKWADETKFSAGYEQGKKAVDDAWKDGSAGDIALAYLKNPGYTANQVVESAPGMVAGGLAGRALMGVGRVAAPAARAGGVGPAVPGLAERALGQWAAPVVAGVGEGAVTAGQQMAQYQGEDQQTNALASLGAGAVTGLVGVGAGRVANKLGLETAETAIAKAGTGAAKAADDVPLSAKRRILGGIVSEALLQELPQSAQEQMWQNWADGKPLMEGVARAATEGALAGGVMGAGANVSDGGAGKRRALAEQQARLLAEAEAEALRADPSRAWTTEAGAADPNQPAGERAAPPEAPDLTTSPGAGVARDGMDFTRDVDTSGLSLQDPAELARQRAATVDYQPGDTTPQWDTQPGAAPVRSGLDMPAPDFDTGALGFDPRPLSERMGLVPAANTPLTKAAALSVDTGASPVQFLGATGRDMQLRQTGPGVANESNVIDVQARVVDERAIPTPRRLTAQDGARESGAIAFQDGVPRSEIAAIPNIVARAEQLRGYDEAAQKAAQPLSLPAPSNLREGLERIRAQREQAARTAQVPPTTGATSVPQASQTQQGSTQQPQAGGPQVGAATATASTVPAGGNRVQAAGLTDGIVITPGKGLIKGKFLSSVDGDGTPGGPWATEGEARNAALQWRKTKATRAAEAVEDRNRKDSYLQKLRSGHTPTAQEVEGLGLRASGADLTYFIPRAADLFGITSRQVRPLIADLIRVGHTDMGAKRESVNPMKALAQMARATTNNTESPTDGAQTQNLGAQSSTAAGAQGQAPQTAVARPDGWRKSMLRAAPIARAMGIDPKGKRLAQVVAEIDARDTQTPTTPAPQPAPGPVRLGRDNRPLSEGGKPFKTRKAAGDAKKLQPMMRVVTVEGGYALAEKTPAQLAAEERASRRLAQPRTGTAGAPLAAHEFIAAEGGLSSVAAADLGVEGNPRIGNRTLFAGQGRGLSIEQATQMLIQDGYLSEGALHNDAYALIKTSLTRPQYNADGYERIAEAEAQTQFEDYLAAHEEAAAEGDADPFGMADEFTTEELDDVGYTDADPALQAEVAALTAQADAMGIDTYAILDDIARTYADATQDEFNAKARDALAAAIARGNQDGGSTAAQAAPAAEPAQEPGLTAPTRADIEAQQEARDKAEREEAARQRAEDQAASQDENRKRIAQASVRAADNFELGQDPLDSLTGQGSIFDDAPAQSAPTAASDDEGRERFTLSIEMFGDVPYRASKPVDAGSGKVVSSRVITAKTKLTAANAERLGLPKDKGTVYAWRVSVIRRANGETYAVIEAMATDNGRSPDGEVLAHFKEVENPEAMERIAPAIVKAAMADWQAAQSQQAPAATEPVAQPITRADVEDAQQQASADNRKKVETKEDDTGNVVKFSRNGARGITPEQRAENFARWSDNAPLISSEQAEAYDFKTGQKIVVEAFHGSARPDRIGGVFDPKRATSGPMAYFTSSPELASSYAKGKEDTSLADEDQSYANWFKFKPPGARSAVSIDRAWHFQTPEVQARIRKLAPQIAMDDTGENIVIDPDNTDGLGNYGWELQQARGNPLAALVESWLSSGTLFNEETKFMDVLRMAGFPVAGVEMDFPNAAYPGVFKTYISMKNPLVVGDMPADVRAALEQAAKADRTKAKPGADMWDKRSHTLRDWWAKLNDPDPQTAAYAWTSIPDKVTDVLKAHGYDGIVDWSGKGGGHQSPVYIPFGPTQVKSVFNRGTFDPTKKDISFGRGANAAIGTPAATIRAAITKAYGKLLGQLESKGLVTLTQTEDEAIEAAARARADKTGQPLAEVRASLMGSVSNSVATDTPAFKRWFKDSKVVDADGRPLVVYHGTSATTLEAFDDSMSGSSMGSASGLDGFYFTADPTTAGLYAKASEKSQHEMFGRFYNRQNIMPVFLSMQNPLIYKKQRGDQITLMDTVKRRVIREAKQGGHDGVIFQGFRDTPTGRGANVADVYVAFRPEQVKSAIGNNGNFDPNDPDIRRSANGAIQGFFDPQTGQSFLVADNLTAEAAPGVLMHEVGIHMAADGSMKALFNRAAMMLKLQRGNQFIKQVQARMDAAGETSGEEAAAYIAEAYENDRANAPASVQRWLADLLAAVKAWMFKKGIMGADRLTVADIAAVARANARSMARDGGATGGQGFGPAFSHAPAGDQTQTEAFKRWFAGSKVVDAEGKPLRVYHGTRREFSIFEPMKPRAAYGNPVGIYFTDDINEAKEFSEDIDGATDERSRVVHAYLSIQSDSDGIIRKRKDGTTEYIVFKPEKIKSAIGNNGDFDPSNPDIRFSRSVAAPERIGGALKSLTVTDLKNQAAFKAADLRPLGLQFLGRRQLVDVYSDMLPELRRYSDLMARMDADKNEAGAGADKLAQDWAKLPDERQLAELMHDSTLAQIDPTKDFVEGDNKTDWTRLRARYQALSPAAKEVYIRARDTYRQHMHDVRSAIKERIERAEMSSERRAALLKRMDDEFFGHIKGVYFPLARFGQYVVVVKGADGKVENVSRAETMAEADTTRRQLLAAFPPGKGFTVGKVLKAKDFVAERDTVGRGFMEQLYGVLDKQGMDAKQRAELEDALGQLYLSSLPDLSWAKHGIHRKGTAGFSQDARRAFAQNVFHGASYLAKLRYGDRLQDELGEMQRRVDAGSTDSSFDSVKAQQVVDEMVKRHDAAMNPKTNALSTALTSLGFMFHLGLSPASAMVNLTQTALVAYPVMGARWGFAKAGAALLQASQEAARGKNDITASLTADEKAAFDEAVRSGVIDVTMAHDLAGIAQGEDRNVSHKLQPVMKAASFLFHHAEKFNRQVTFVAAYRLAREAGADAKAAYAQAAQATYDGHFDYSANNRPRVMQGNVARVLLLFKQYGQNMVYTLARSAQQSLKGATPEARAQARKALGGLLTTHAMAAGVLGLPMVTTLLAAASMIGGDDDEPWDAKVALQNLLADTFGQKPAEVLAHGLSRLTPWDISGRVGLDKLIFPDVQEGLEGQRLAESAMTAALGPVAGIGINVLKGLQEMSEGRYLRGLETMAPSVARGPLKAIRYGSEGVKDKTGIVVQDEVDAAALWGQAAGFSPSSVRNAYEGKSAIVSHDRALQARRSALVEQFAMAAMAKDEEGKAEAREAIAKFNEKNPNRRIQPMHLAQSVAMRQKRIREAQDGVYLPGKRRDAVEVGRFAFAGTD